MRVRWGIVGTGRMAQVFAQELRTLEPAGAALQAIASRAADRARAFARRFDIPAAYSSIEELTADPCVDAVYVASPPSAHAPHVRACIEAGKAVLCEKPFTLNAHEAAGLIALARAKGVFLMEAMWTRFLPSAVALRQALAAGRIGELRLVIAGGGFIPDPAPGHYLFDRSLGGGVLLDAGVYLVSLASMVLGTPTRIVASGDLGASGVDEHDTVLLEHANGARALLYVSLRTRRPPDMELLGSEGRIHLHDPIFRPVSYTLTRADGTQSRIELPISGSGYGYQLVEAMRCMREGRPESLVMPLDETLSIMQTLDEARRQFGLRYHTDR